jgi:hypothetical protein
METCKSLRLTQVSYRKSDLTADLTVAATVFWPFVAEDWLSITVTLSSGNCLLQSFPMQYIVGMAGMSILWRLVNPCA